MALRFRHIHATDGFLFHDVIHLRIPVPHIWKMVLMFLLIFLLPFTFNRGLLDAHCARILFELVKAATPVLRPKSTATNFRELAKLLSKKSSAAACFVFVLKCYVCYVGLQVKNEGISFNQPVIFRTVNHPARSPCKLMTFSEERDFMIWEALHCSKLRQVRKYRETTYVPSVRTVTGSEQICLQKGIRTLRGRIEILAKPNRDSLLQYKHPISLIKENCARLNISCGFIKQASTEDSSTWISFSSPQHRVIISFPDHLRPGLTAIRECALAVKTGANEDVYTKITFSIELAMRHSTCFTKGSVVDTIKVPHLKIHVVPLVLLFLVEGVCRRYFNRLVETTSGKHGQEEYLSVATEEFLS